MEAIMYEVYRTSDAANIPRDVALSRVRHLYATTWMSVEEAANRVIADINSASQ